MKAVELTMLACLAAGGAGAQGSRFVPIDPWDQIQTMVRGVNILGYDPVWRDPAKARFQERHFARIREGGFQAVRINLQAFSHMDAANRLDKRWFQTLDWASKTPWRTGWR